MNGEEYNVVKYQALNITDELFREKSLKNENRNADDFSDRINRITDLLDEKLNSSSK